jgi:hypothetical protein
MIRAWHIFLLATFILWGIQFLGWSQSGLWSALTVGDVFSSIGLPHFQPPPTEWGAVASQLLDSNSGFICLVLALAALAFSSGNPRHF